MNYQYIADSFIRGYQQNFSSYYNTYSKMETKNDRKVTIILWIKTGFGLLSYSSCRSPSVMGFTYTSYLVQTLYGSTRTHRYICTDTTFATGAHLVVLFSSSCVDQSVLQFKLYILTLSSPRRIL